ncbi:MAG: AraC family transcriptional regulator [Lachnospiraceae bacterium]|nr:AraC family transcriptional regulator [Lachnospiraceae bacterium]
MNNEVGKLQEALRIESLVNEELVLKDVVQNIYEYDEDPRLSLLHPIVSGTTTLRLPLKLHFSKVNILLFIFSIEGGLEIKQNDTTITTNPGTCIALNLAHGADMFTTMLPCGFRFYYVGGECPKEFNEILSHPLNIDLTNQNPSPLTLEQLSCIPIKIDKPILFQFHAKITEILCTYAMIYYNSSENTLNIDDSPNVPSYLSIMYELIHNHSENPFSLDYFENKLGISRYRLCREYHAYYGVSPIKDLNHIRILNAKKLLLTSSMQIQEVSNSVGFDDVTHFIRLFKRETGHTPGQFRTL